MILPKHRSISTCVTQPYSMHRMALTKWNEIKSMHCSSWELLRLHMQLGTHKIGIAAQAN